MGLVYQMVDAYVVGNALVPTQNILPVVCFAEKLQQITAQPTVNILCGTATLNVYRQTQK